LRSSRTNYAALLNTCSRKTPTFIADFPDALPYSSLT
jgi:hypothetical protein